jgi:hypothetical protein
MEKILGEKGLELVNYRKQLDGVKHNDFLKEAVVELIKTKVSKEEVDLIMSVSSARGLDEKLLDMPNYIKKEEEILQEKKVKFEEEALKFNNNIRKKESSWNKDVKLFYTVDSDYEKNTYTVIRKFGLGQKFLEEYFGVSNKKILTRLMKENGFLKDYTELRISTVLRKIINSVDVACGTIEIGKAYFSEEKNTYNVNLTITVSVEDDMREMARSIRILLCAIEAKFSLTEF